MIADRRLSLVIIVHQNKGGILCENRSKKSLFFNRMHAHQGIEVTDCSISLVHRFTDRQQLIGKSDYISRELAGVLR